MRLLTLAALAASAHATMHTPTTGDGWYDGRATFFGASDSLVDVFERVRGPGSYGDLHYGSCGYYNKPQVGEERERDQRGGAGRTLGAHQTPHSPPRLLPRPQGVKTIRPQDLPFDQVFAAAAADSNPDMAGSCGRCYEVRCKTGVVPKEFHDDKGAMTPFKISEVGGREGEGEGGGPKKRTKTRRDADPAPPPTRPPQHFYMPKYDTNLKDTQGRTWLGNPWEKEGLQGAVCWGNETTWVRIVDSCPPTTTSPWCKADSSVFHFDMSYWAFEKLAHPLNGVMPIQFRPVDCDTREPAKTFLPGAISKDAIYDAGIRTGWTMYTWLNGYQLFSVAGASKKATPACASLLSGGGMRFACRGCEAAGYQPFANATHVSFRVKADASVLKFPDSPAGSVPPLKAYLIRGHDGQENYCGEVFLKATAPTAKLADGWYAFDVPLARFMCNSPTGQEITGFGLSHANATVYANNGAGAATADFVGVCVDKVAVGRGAVPEAAAAAVVAAPVARVAAGGRVTAAPALAPVARQPAPAPAGARWASGADLAPPARTVATATAGR